MSAPQNAAHTNRLAGATSPYLLQHAHNPVDWWQWGPEALAEASLLAIPVTPDEWHVHHFPVE